MTQDPNELAAVIAAVLAATQQRAEPEPTPAATVYTVDEAAEQLKVSRSLIYSMVRDGRLRSLTLGRRRLIPATEIDRLIRGEAAA